MMTLIQPSRGWRHIDFREIWAYRELLYFFTWRDLKIRYKQTVIGVLWAVLQPFLTMVVFSVFFGHFVKVPSEGVPYPIFVYLGLLPWTLFSQSLSRASESVVSHSNLIKKVYFPRLIIPVSASLSAVVDFFISLVILLIMMLFYKIVPAVGIIYLPFLVMLCFLCSIGIGFWLAAINVMYRDVRYAIPFLIQLGMYVTPVIYPVSVVPEKFSWIIYLNPMTGIIEGFRASLLGYKAMPVAGIGISFLVTVIFLLSGLFYFRKVERVFADVI
ncbi:MAG: ABC transporter permease [Candidatus Omnitrophota bacterium]|nr:ABC transporter permease [Candidatus Omnitrophota bacterium]